MKMWFKWANSASHGSSFRPNIIKHAHANWKHTFVHAVGECSLKETEAKQALSMCVFED